MRDAKDPYPRSIATVNGPAMAYVQEDPADQIGAALAEWIKGLD